VSRTLQNQLQLYLDYVAKTGGRPDFSTPPVSDQFARIFDLRELAALPPPKEANAWLAEFVELNKQEKFFFSLNRYLFVADKLTTAG